MQDNIYVGIDWAWNEHQVGVVSEEGELLSEFAVKHSGDGLNQLCDRLKKIAGGDVSRVKVAIEVPHGAVVETLLENLFSVFSINPKQMDRFRDRYGPSGAKDDSRDAFVMGDSLRTDEKCFRKLVLSEPLLVELKEWSRMSDELKKEINRQCNRLSEQLRRYYPQFLGFDADLSTEWILELWHKAPTPAKGSRLHLSTIQKLLKKHRIRRISAKSLSEKLKEAPLKVADGVEQASVAHISVLSEQIRLLNRQHKETIKKLEQICEKLASTDESDKCGQSDVTILRSLQGIGTTVLATLLAEAHQPLKARDYHSLRLLCGSAPVTKSSGKSKKISVRYASNPRLRNAAYHWARNASQRDPISMKKYAVLRSRGQSHGRALRSISDRLLEVACAMLRDGTVYDPEKRKSYSTLATAAQT